jgi:hypothetical protein
VQHDGPSHEDSSDLLASLAEPPRSHVLAPCVLTTTKASTSSMVHAQIELDHLARLPMARSWLDLLAF